MFPSFSTYGSPSNSIYRSDILLNLIMSLGRHVSAFELRNKLSQYGFSANAVRAAVERMQEV
jgi:DNA-binding transcriptional regulator PaaX